MSDNSLIQWCMATWNFLIGCTKKSKGCANCYAIRQAWRMMHNPNPKIAKKFAGTVHKDSKGELNWTGHINFDAETLALPLHWRLPKQIFVNSLSDLFHPNVKDEWIDAAFAVMALCPQHTFQILTKHPDRAVRYFLNESLNSPWEKRREAIEAAMDFRMNAIGQQAFDRFDVMFSGDAKSDDFVQFDLPLPNVHILTSVEDQPSADERFPWLLRIPAAVHGVSAEPLLGPVNLYLPESDCNHLSMDGYGPDLWKCGLCNGILREVELSPTRVAHVPALDWVIVGGESGPKARVMRVDWARDLIQQCKQVKVPVFMKQVGRWPSGDPDEFVTSGDTWSNSDESEGGPILKSHKGGDPGEWPSDLRVREFPEVKQRPYKWKCRVNE